MLNPTQLIKLGMNQVTDHAPAILTAFGAVGVVGTAVLSGKASYEACGRVRNEIDDRVDKAQTDMSVDIELTKTEVVKLVWPLYVPAITTGTVSIVAIIMSHRISSKRAAVLAAAYALNQDKLEEYQDKVKEKLGVKKEKDVRDEINQDRVNAAAEGGFAFANPMAGKVWIMEAYTGRPFMSTVEDVKKAANEVNYLIQREGSARMSDFYDKLNTINKIPVLDHVSMSDRFGWTREDLLSLDWSTTTSPDGAIPVHVFEYVGGPIMEPEREATFR